MSTPSANKTEATGQASATVAEATRVWGRIGVLSFGGPAAQIALMHREVVEERNWLSERQFLNALSFCMLLPGPEAMQLATYAGWRMHGTLGGLIAGLLFILPGAAIMLALAGVYAAFGNVPLVEAIFFGIKAAVVIIVIEALIRVSKRALNGGLYWAIAALTFVAIFFFALPYPLIVIAAGLVGMFAAVPNPRTDDGSASAPRSWGDMLRTTAVWLLIWLGPLLALRVILPDSMLNAIAVFFSKLAVVTFGGAYAVLAYMGQDVVDRAGWLTAGEMMDGLGLAETTPGPLILVTQFVGFVAAEKIGGFWFGAVAAGVTLWATFAPCFLWIFAGAPYIEWISNQPRLKGALNAITAAVVGVILNLSIWFALHVFFARVDKYENGVFTTWWPQLLTFQWPAFIVAGIAAFLIFRRHLGLPAVLLICAGVGLILSGITMPIMAE
ncbi:MAG: chromate efflux transporter [Pseudomonadota bacterium]